MGLLSRAEGKDADPSVLDAMGQALVDRLERLPQKKTTPYTALSLFKAYGLCQAGICLALKNGVYSSYASIGFGIESVSIPGEKIGPAEENSSGYFRLDSGKIPELKNIGDDFGYWLFPLDKEEPWGAAMIMGIPSSSNPEFVSAILEAVTNKILVPFVPMDQTETESPLSFASPVADKIADYYLSHSDFNCILLEIPGGIEDKADFYNMLSEMINTPGTVIPLSSGSPLILLPGSMDRELIAHRLSKTLNTKPLLSFEATSPENVISQIQSLI